MPAPPPDLFDVVDESDHVLRRETRAEVHRQRLRHRAVHVLVFNAAGALYLQRRSATKDTYPGRWTTSCSGHVDAGEDYDTAAVRELAEELGVRLPPAEKLEGPAQARPFSVPSGALLPFQKHSPCRDTGWEFIWIYSLSWNGPLAPDPGEVAEGRWVAPAELDAWLAREPRAFTPSFILVWKLWRERPVSVSSDSSP